MRSTPAVRWDGWSILLCAAHAGPAGAAPPDGRRTLWDHSPPGVAGAGTLAPLAGGTTTLFLNFDGATITKAAGVSSAHTNTSFLCGATIKAFEHAALGADRTAVIADLVQGVEQLFAPFDLQVVTARPAAPPYHMVVIGGTPDTCGFPSGYSGMAPLDCTNAVSTDLALVFSDGITSAEMLAVVIAHEAGHAFGLPHSSAACDVMSIMLCTGADGGLGVKVFLDREVDVTPDQAGLCGLHRTNSWRLLYRALGPRPGSGAELRIDPAVRPARGPRIPVPRGGAGRTLRVDDGGPGEGDAPGLPAADGCSVALSADGALGLRWPGALLLLLTLMTRWPPWRRHKRVERWHGHPGRTDLFNR